jgi:hypothetical protein
MPTIDSVLVPSGGLKIKGLSENAKMVRSVKNKHQDGAIDRRLASLPNNLDFCREL